MAVPPTNAASARALRERKAQLDRLLSEELPRNRREIQEAKEFGDLSENFEYESARNRERQLLARLETLQREIREAAEFDFSLAEAGEEAAPGTRVELRFEDGTERVLNILGLWDFDEELCVISAHAPLAQLVIGRKAGDSVSVPDPDFDGEFLSAEIVSVGPLPPEVLAWAR